MSTPIRLLVVDDHTLFRRGLIALLGQYPEVQVVGEAGDAGEAKRAAAALQPDLVLLDNHLPGVRGIDVVQELRATSTASRILMLTVSEDENDLSTALQNGAQGYVLKTIDGPALLDAIVRCSRGDTVISPELTGKLVTALCCAGKTRDATGLEIGAPPERPALSPREREIVRHIARGASNKEIARALDIAETTVKIHVQHILRKLGLSSRVQAAVYATEHLGTE
jgi:two-component system nitrate/nitrite response regulator NarL